MLDVENVSHLQRANANEIVIPDEHVPHLLAKHVTDPGVPQFFDDLILKGREGQRPAGSKNSQDFKWSNIIKYLHFINLNMDGC